MDSGSRGSRRLVFFAGDETESLFKESLGLCNSKDSPNIPEDFSPLNFRFSNSNSPFLGKRSGADRKTPPSFSPQFGLQPLSPSFAINPVVRKRPKRETLPSPLKNTLEDFRFEPILQNLAHISSEMAQQTKDIDQIDNRSVCGSYLKLAESTAIGSHSKNTFDRPFTDDLSEMLLSDKEVDDDFRPKSSGICKLVKMDPIYQLINAYFDNRECQPFIESIDQDYEFQILNIIFTYLKLTFKNTGKMTSTEKIAALLKSQPSRPKKKRKMIQLIFTRTYRTLRHRFDRSLDPYHPTGQSLRLFNEYYFAGTAHYSGLADDQFDLAKNIKNGNLAYGFIEKFFSSSKFAEDFSAFLKNEYLPCYRTTRIRKLGLVFARWEEFFLECPRQSDPVERIRTEMLGPRFQFVWSDIEVAHFFQYFYDLCPKTSPQT
jgi:hypothetical protein